MISGTTVNAGSGTMLVVAVGDHSIAGKIKKSVYGKEGQELSPLYHKLDTMANRIGKCGMQGGGGGGGGGVQAPRCRVAARNGLPSGSS